MTTKRAIITASLLELIATSPRHQWSTKAPARKGYVKMRNKMARRSRRINRQRAR